MCSFAYQRGSLSHDESRIICTSTLNTDQHMWSDRRNLSTHLDLRVSFSVLVGYQDFFCNQSSRKIFWCVQLFLFSFLNSSRDQCKPWNDSWSYCLSELMNSRFVSLGVWEIFHECTEWNNSSFKWFPKTSFMGVFLFCQEILDISQIAIAFPRIWPDCNNAADVLPLLVVLLFLQCRLLLSDKA